MAETWSASLFLDMLNSSDFKPDKSNFWWTQLFINRVDFVYKYRTAVIEDRMEETPSKTQQILNMWFRGGGEANFIDQNSQTHKLNWGRITWGLAQGIMVLTTRKEKQKKNYDQIWDS